MERPYVQALAEVMKSMKTIQGLIDEERKDIECDIVRSLRWDMRYTNGHVPVTMSKAADEIERLRAELAELRVRSK